MNFNMRGPELWGVEIFALDKIRIKEQSTQEEWEARPDQGHFIKITGELTLGRTQCQNTLPRNMWDRQRYGGFLSDGETRFWWIIHDSNITGRNRAVRWFDVVFAKHIHADAFADRMRSHDSWRKSVRLEWESYLVSGLQGFNRLRLGGPEFPRSKRWLSFRSRAASRWVRHDRFWIGHDADDLNRTVPDRRPWNYVPSISVQIFGPEGLLQEYII